MYYIKKIFKSIFSIYIISTISFFLVSFIPGDPATIILGIDANKEQILEFRKTFGLDKPIVERYISWLMDAIKGEFGVSYRYGVSVKSLITETLPITLLIAFICIVIIFFSSVIFSFYLNKIKSKTLYKIYDIILGISISIPTFWLGILSIFIFSVILRWFNISYNGSYSSLIAPCLIISVPYIGLMTINLRKSIYTETRNDYVKFLYSNGMSKHFLNIYVLKNAIIKTLPLFALITIDLITGIVIVEQIFSIPGIGKLLLSSISTRDLKLIQGLIIYTSFSVIIINLIIEFIYSILDKRIRVGLK